MLRRISQTERLVSLVGPFCCPPKLQDRRIAVVGDHRIGQAVPLEDPRQPLADQGLTIVGRPRFWSRQRRCLG
jgi:hypothetical protein